MTDGEESPDIPTKKILDLDSPLENHIITTKDDVTYINMDPVPLSMLEVIDGSDTPPPTSLPQKPLPPPGATAASSTSGDKEGVEFNSSPWPLPNASHFSNGVDSFSCPLCGETYPTHDELKDHLSIHSLENPFANKFFNTALYDGNGYIQAMKNFRCMEESPEHSCSICSRTFSQLSSLKKHMKMHSRDRPFNCSECGKSYSEISYLKRHILTHAGNNQNNFCSICNTKFNDINSLRQHMQMHAAKVKPHSCMVCGKLYNRLAVLKRHIKLHFNSNHHINNISDNNVDNSDFDNFETDDNFNDDDDDDGEVDDNENEDCETFKIKPKIVSTKNHVCSTCSKVFSSLGNLQRHFRIHTGEKPYVCSICNSCFSQLSHLRQHHQTHTDEKFECPICSTCISNDRNFKRHMRLHTGERPYKCDICSATFTQQSHLKKHSRTHNNTTYNCSSCEISLPDLNEYKKHMKKHAGEKPYACSICDSSYSDINQLKEHVDTHSIDNQRVSGDNHDHFDVNPVKVNSNFKSTKDCSVQAEPFSVDSEKVDYSFNDKSDLIEVNIFNETKNSTMSSCSIDRETSIPDSVTNSS